MAGNRRWPWRLLRGIRTRWRNPGPNSVRRADAGTFFSGPPNDKGGALTPLVFAARENCLECAKILLDAKADINQTTKYGWTPLLTATQNRHYKLGPFLLDHGANPNIANNGGWSPLYLATDNRNIEGGDYPVRPAGHGPPGLHPAPDRPRAPT